jgi:predicted NBD/HSP70 family sugar kinase
MIACVDIGGGTTRVGFSSDGKTFIKIIKFTTENVFADEIKHIAEEIKVVALTPEAIIIAAAGSMDREKGIIISWGQKKSWWGQKVFEPIFQYFPQAKLLIENDANLAALGEAVFGAGKNYSLVGYVTLSTGVGGCLITNKQIIPHKFGIEPGHQIVNFLEPKIWSCGQKGCFEAYASGTAFKQIYGVNPENCTDENIWKKYGEQVAVGIANLITFWSPEVIIIGGGVSGKFDSFIKPLEKKLVDLLPMYKIPEIIKSQLDEAGLYGCLAYYKN